MSLPVHVHDPSSMRHVAVSPYGELATSPLHFDDVYQVTVGEINTGYNLIEPSAGQFFVITGLYIKANRLVSNTVDADFELYETGSADSTTVSKSLFTVQLVRGNAVQFAGLRLRVSSGVWVNAKTTDDDFYVTVFGYYVDESEASS